MIRKYIALALLLVYFALISTIFLAPQFAEKYFMYFIAYHALYMFVASAINASFEEDGLVTDKSEKDHFNPYGNIADGMKDAFVNGNSIARHYWGF